MSDTPRTDACVWRHPLRPDEECVDASIARALEQELTAAKHNRDYWREKVENLLVPDESKNGAVR